MVSGQMMSKNWLNHPIVQLYFSGLLNVLLLDCLGIFGTVCALLNSSPGSGVTDNFFVALDTTIMGLFFAILCKVADSQYQQLQLLA